MRHEILYCERRKFVVDTGYRQTVKARDFGSRMCEFESHCPCFSKGVNMNFTEQKLEKEISNHIRVIASILAKGHDVELRKTTGDFLKIVEVRKTIKN